MVSLYFFDSAILLTLGFILFRQSVSERVLMSTQDSIDTIVTQLGKAKGEIVAKIVDLQNQVDAAGVSDKVDLTALTAAAQALDDVVPDAPAAPADVPAEEPAASTDVPSDAPPF